MRKATKLIIIFPVYEKGDAVIFKMRSLLVLSFTKYRQADKFYKIKEIESFRQNDKDIGDAFQKKFNMKPMGNRLLGKPRGG